MRALIDDCAGRPAVLGIVAVGHQDDDLVEIGRGAGALNGATGDSVCQASCSPMVTLVLPAGVIASTLLLSAVQSVDSVIMAVGQADAWCARYMVAGLPSTGCGVQHIVVLVAVIDAAVPGAVAVGRPGAVLEMQLFSSGMTIAASAVGGIPVGPVDPGRVDIAGADIDVDGERDDGDFDVARGLLGILEVVRRLWAASLRAVILPLDAIEPVLSNASAILSFLMPHTTSPLALISTCGWPIRRQNIVETVAEPDSFRLKLPCCGEVNCGVTWTLLASGRSNIEVK